MARNRPERPLTDAEIDRLREEMEDQRDEIRAYLEEQGVDVSSWEDTEAARADGGDS